MARNRRAAFRGSSPAQIIGKLSAWVAAALVVNASRKKKQRGGWLRRAAGILMVAG
jgi:hypothetical protein